ncbi:MAG TPA: 50S ribosomal protein L21 [bacterium]|nr:50S ribosomal protein L21 [bacterium]HOL49454.1 50S ribosomal protein L21 [bacterium]HPO51551.1 50S ribosomal protein L21 [bacterium]
MKAIIGLSGKQYCVKEGDTFEVFKLSHQKGNQFTIQDILAIEKQGSLITDKEFLKNCAVIAEVIDEKKGEKLYVFKKKKKTGYSKKTGHRDILSVVKIVRIQTSDAAS